jgi:hypothetical protein
MKDIFSKPRIPQLLALTVIVATALLVYRNSSLFGAPAAELNQASQPALQALRTIYSPAGEQKAWEQAACVNMTQKGCDLFTFYYAPIIWKSGVSGTNPQFVGVVETLADDSEIWVANLTIHGALQPIFIQVEKRANNQWVLARILFDEEAKQYEK